MSNPKGDRCAGCVFAKMVCDGDNKGNLLCRRYPPVPTRDLFWAQYPFVLEDGWCGEWRDKSHSEVLNEAIEAGLPPLFGMTSAEFLAAARQSAKAWDKAFNLRGKDNHGGEDRET